MEEDSSSEDESEKPIRQQSHQITTKISKTQTLVKDITSQPVPIPPTLDKVVIKKGYDPKQGKSDFYIVALLYMCVYI